MKQVFRLVHEQARIRAVEAIHSAPAGYIVRVEPSTRTLEQNSILWPLLSCLANQTNWHGEKLNSEEWKDLLTAGLVKSKVRPNIDGTGFVILGQKTSTMSKETFSELIELIFAFGAERGVVFKQ